MLALPALCKGILYDDDCMTGAWDLVKRWHFGLRLALADAAQKIGLEARAGRIKFQELALELLNIAMIGLARQHATDEAGNDESIYLLRILDQVRMGVNQASLTIDRWKGRWNYDVQRLVQACSYEAEATF
jgi:glutamate--cysteine ligase